MPQEVNYITHMKAKHGITLHKKERFVLMKEFQKKIGELHPNKELRFMTLKSTEDKDEQQEAVHKLRALLRLTMMLPSENLIHMAQIARSSSTRAYAGHSHDMRNIFEINNLNLTEFARSFALYKNLGPQAMQNLKHVDLKDSAKDKKRSFKDRQRNEGNEKAKNDEAKMFTKRLLKAQQKDIEKKIYKEGEGGTGLYKDKLQNNLN